MCVFDRVQLKEGNAKQGRAWGVYYFRGKPEGEGKVKEVRSSLKKQWLVLQEGETRPPSEIWEQMKVEAAKAHEAGATAN
jgi:hypothetical protein